MFSILFLIVIFILIIVLIVYLAKAQKKFWIKYNEYEDKIKKSENYEKGIAMVNELYKLSFHPNISDKVKLLHMYLNGKFNK